MIWHFLSDIQNSLLIHLRIRLYMIQIYRQKLLLDKNINEMKRNTMMAIIGKMNVLYQNITDKATEYNYQQTIMPLYNEYLTFYSQCREYISQFRQLINSKLSSYPFWDAEVGKWYDDLAIEKSGLEDAIDSSSFYINDDLIITTYDTFYKKFFEHKLIDILYSLKNQRTEMHFTSQECKEKFITILSENACNITDNSDILEIVSTPNI